MAQPSSRQGLIDYGLRQLGAPVLEINIDDDQIDDLLDDAVQVFNERHFDGVEEMYLITSQFHHLDQKILIPLIFRKMLLVHFVKKVK